MSNSVHGKIHDLLCANGIQYRARFVPQSLSRNRHEKDLSLNWFADFKREGMAVFSIEYMQGIAHMPGYDHRMASTNDGHKAAKRAAEEGIAPSLRGRFLPGKLPEPKATDVLHCIVLDADCLTEPFEDWCANYGYGSDSRKAESLYLLCVKISREAMAVFGAPLLAQIRDLLQDY
jgi:hypothetical protein